MTASKYFYVPFQLPFSSPEVYDGMCSKFAFDDTAGLVALRAENYRIQFYSLFDDREISEVKIFCWYLIFLMD